MRLPSAILAIVLCSSQWLAGQQGNGTPDSLEHYFQFEDTPFLGCLFTYFPPVFIQHGIELKGFVRSRTFRTLRSRYGDVRAVDAVFVRAMQMTNDNTAIALLLAAVATMDHRLVGLKVPVFQLFFPLTNESFEQFERRVGNLPTRLYADSPPSLSGDRDKLQHFFGSAFLTFVFESRDAADRFGDFVEKEEDTFIVGGVNDWRDVRTNRQGQKFGEALLNNNHHLPSEFLMRYISPKTVGTFVPVLCLGAW